MLNYFFNCYFLKAFYFGLKQSTFILVIIIIIIVCIIIIFFVILMTKINYINKKTNLINYLLNNIIKNLMIILYKDDILIFCIILSLSFLISLKIKIKTRKI